MVSSATTNGYVWQKCLAPKLIVCRNAWLCKNSFEGMVSWLFCIEITGETRIASGKKSAFFWVNGNMTMFYHLKLPANVFCFIFNTLSLEMKLFCNAMSSLFEDIKSSKLQFFCLHGVK